MKNKDLKQKNNNNQNMTAFICNSAIVYPKWIQSIVNSFISSSTSFCYQFLHYRLTYSFIHHLFLF